MSCTSSDTCPIATDSFCHRTAEEKIQILKGHPHLIDSLPVCEDLVLNSFADLSAGDRQMLLGLARTAKLDPFTNMTCMGSVLNSRVTQIVRRVNEYDHLVFTPTLDLVVFFVEWIIATGHLSEFKLANPVRKVAAKRFPCVLHDVSKLDSVFAAIRRLDQAETDRISELYRLEMERAGNK